MATRQDALVILPRPRPIAEIIASTTACFAEVGIKPVLRPMVVFNDIRGEEREPEEAASWDDAMARVASWPGLGGTESEIGGGETLSLFFHGTEPGQVDAIGLSVRAKAYLLNQEVQSAYDRLTFDLHSLLGASRTIAGGDLLSPGTWWAQEVDRVRRDRYEGQYAIDHRQRACM